MDFRINNKRESKEYIVSHRLNSVPEIFLDKNEYERAVSFIKNNPADLYVVRDAEHSSAKYFYIHSFEDYLECVSFYQGKIILAVSVNGYQNKVLLGAIEVNGTNLRLCATEKKELDHRTMYQGAEYNFETDIFDHCLNRIPGFDAIYCYILEHHLQGYTVEFTVFDQPVGSYFENVLINEVRNY